LIYASKWTAGISVIGEKVVLDIPKFPDVFPKAFIERSRKYETF